MFHIHLQFRRLIESSEEKRRRRRRRKRKRKSRDDQNEICLHQSIKAKSERTCASTLPSLFQINVDSREWLDLNESDKSFPNREFQWQFDQQWTVGRLSRRKDLIILSDFDNRRWTISDIVNHLNDRSRFSRDTQWERKREKKSFQTGSSN